MITCKPNARVSFEDFQDVLHACTSLCDIIIIFLITLIHVHCSQLILCNCDSIELVLPEEPYGRLFERKMPSSTLVCVLFGQWLTPIT